ncbi:MAG: dehydrogenase, partial [Pseudomonadota bacterium]
FPKIFWMTAEQVVQQSLSELERNPKPIFVPGLFNKFLRLLNKYLPEWVTNFLVRRNASLARKTD